MRITILVLAVLLSSARLIAQETIPFEYTSEDDNRLIKENDSVKFFVASDDTTRTVCLNEEAGTYRLLNKDRKLIADGAFVMEGEKFMQTGKWTERYDNGKVKITGYYDKGKPIGTWQEYYDNGKPSLTANYAILKDDVGSITSCLSGSFMEYYKDGKLKTLGFYAAAPTKDVDTMEVTDPVSGTKHLMLQKTISYKPEKEGKWENYDENGELVGDEGKGEK